MTPAVRLRVASSRNLPSAASMMKSEAVKLALHKLLAAGPEGPSPYELGKDLFGPHTDAPPGEDVARHSKRLLRAHFRGRRR